MQYFNIVSDFAALVLNRKLNFVAHIAFRSSFPGLLNDENNSLICNILLSSIQNHDTHSRSRSTETHSSHCVVKRNTINVVIALLLSFGICFIFKHFILIRNNQGNILHTKMNNLSWTYCVKIKRKLVRVVKFAFFA